MFLQRSFIMAFLESAINKMVILCYFEVGEGKVFPRVWNWNKDDGLAERPVYRNGRILWGKEKEWPL